MKALIASLLLAFSFSTSACSAEAPTEPPKKAEPVTKTVCIMVYDAQQKKEVKKCREMKIREKHKGTPVPQK